MTKLLKTNTKKYLSNIQAAILEAVNFEDLGDIELNNRQKIEYLMADFKACANYPNNKKRIPNEQNRLADWLQGLPNCLNIPFTNYDILNFMAKMHEVTAIPEQKEDVIINGYFGHIAFNILKMYRTLNQK